MGIGRKFVTFAAVVGLTVIGGGFAFASDTANQTLSYSINATRNLSLSSATATIPGVDKTSDSDSSTDAGTVTYSTDSGSDKITADLSAAMEANMDLTVSMANTTAGTCTENGTELTSVNLDSGNATSVITGINNCSVSAVASITYTLSTGGTPATPGAYSKTVTYLISAT